MNNKVTLPDPSRLLEIRLESIGGLGAHAAGQILARSAVLRMNLNGAHFSSYGSEKKGSAVRSYIRLGSAETSIRTSARIDFPDVIVVFHAALLEHPVTLGGMKSSSILIVNVPVGGLPQALSRVPANAKIVRIDATQIAIEEKSRPNAVLMGTLTAVLPFLDAAAVLEGLSEGFAHHNPEAVAANERAFTRGALEFDVLDDVGEGVGDLPVVRPSPVWGYATAPIGGVIPMSGNTVSNDLSVSRAGWLPVFHPQECVHCGLCSFVCPDFCLVWSEEGGDKDTAYARLRGVDYRYCKGCMRCIESCPMEAMTREAETPGLADRLEVPLYPEITNRQGGAHGN